MTDLDRSFQECERISRSSGSNFYRSFQFLRHDRRRAMHALYAFARLADDATDPPSVHAESQTRVQSMHDLPQVDREIGWNLDAWLGWIESLNAPREPSSTNATTPSVCDSLRQIRPALADSVQRFEIPKALLAEIVRGVDADTRPNEIHSWNDLRQYSFQVASAVGLCCAAIWTEPGSLVQNKPLWNAAIDCGLAFQLTNILRDLVEDSQRHRVYLPSNELTLFGIDRARWLDTLARPYAKAPNAKELNDLGDWRGLLEVQLERADALYERGWRVIEHLESDSARMFSLMWQTYRTLFQKIQASPPRVFSERVRLGPIDKWKLASSHFFTPQFHRCVHRTNQQIRRDATRPLSTLSSTLSTSSIETPQRISSTHSNSNTPPKVAVIGGGLAGIQAAIHLARHGCSVDLVEAKSRLGGRVGSFFDPIAQSHVDDCQHVGMVCCSELRRFLHLTSQESQWSIQETLHFVSKSGKKISVSAWPLPAPFHLSGLLLRWPDLRALDRLQIARGLIALMGTRSNPRFEKTPALDWLREHGQSDQAISAFWTTILVSALGEQIHRVTMGPVRKVLIDGFAATRDAFHLMVPQHPLSELIDQNCRGVLEQLGVQLRASESVEKLAELPNGKWRVGTSIEKTLGDCAANRNPNNEFDAIVIAVPWHRASSVLNNLESNSSSPDPDQCDVNSQSVGELANQLEASPITGVHTWWDRPWLDQPHAILIDRLCQWVFPGPKEGTSNRCDATTNTSNETYYQIVISGSRDLPRGDPASILQSIQKDLAEVFPESANSTMVRGKVVTDPHSVFSVSPGHEASRIQQNILGARGIFIAGDWTDTGWPATMEGAVRSGSLAAEYTLEHLQRPARLLKRPY